MRRTAWFGTFTVITLTSVSLLSASSVSKVQASDALPVKVTVTHGELIAGVATYTLDLGQPGASVGDQVVIYTPLSKPNGYLTGTLTTTAIDVPSVGKQIRQARFSFRFKSSTDDSLEVQGTSIYNVYSPTLSIGTRTVRTVLGGTGIYAGASGYVVTTHPTIKKWIHTFYLRIPS